MAHTNQSESAPFLRYVIKYLRGLVALYDWLIRELSINQNK